MKEEPSASLWTHSFIWWCHVQHCVCVCVLEGECVGLCMSVGVWNFNLLSDPRVRPVGSEEGGCGLSGGRMMLLSSPRPQTHLCQWVHACTCPHWKHESIVGLTWTWNLSKHSRSKGKERKEEKDWMKTVKGLKCQRYDYLSISLNETHLAGLVSHSQWDPEVKGASNHDNQAAVDHRQQGNAESEEPLYTGSALLYILFLQTSGGVASGLADNRCVWVC